MLFMSYTSWYALQICSRINSNRRKEVTFLRKAYIAVLKRYFCRRLKSARVSHHLTQSEMADILQIDIRSYIDLEHGNSCCSGLTLALFLIYCSHDSDMFLRELRSELEEVSHTKA